MKRDDFLNQVGECNNIKVTFYNEEEIPAIVDLDVVSVEDYDDEIVIRGSGNTFVILSGNPDICSSGNDKKEFMFSQGFLKIGVIINR